MRHKTLAGAAAVSGAAWLYWKFLRTPLLTWGASADEAAARLPGDELLENADGVATRAITIDAPPAAVWPWIAQMGPSPRGGAYTYDWIENLLGLNMHSADRVLPDYQHPQVGDGFGLGMNKMSFKIVEPEHAARDAVCGRQLGLDIRARGPGRTHAPDQPQPLPAAQAEGQTWDDPDGARLTHHGTQDAARHQPASRAARRRTK
jgi:hypothetical protein